MLTSDLVVAGLNGYVVYPTQQLSSGLAPLSLISNITSNAKTVCVKPGQFLLDSDPSLIKDMLVSASDAWASARHVAYSIELLLRITMPFVL